MKPSYRTSHGALCALSLCLVAFSIASCTGQTQLTKRQNFVSYLDQFKGKTQEQLKQEINFQQFGFDASKTKLSKQDQTTVQYAIYRPVTVPIPIFEPTIDGSRMNTSLPSSRNAYQMQMTCNIIFHLENQTVTHWESKGKAC